MHRLRDDATVEDQAILLWFENDAVLAGSRSRRSLTPPPGLFFYSRRPLSRKGDHRHAATTTYLLVG